MHYNIYMYGTHTYIFVMCKIYSYIFLTRKIVKAEDKLRMIYCETSQKLLWELI